MAAKECGTFRSGRVQRAPPPGGQYSDLDRPLKLLTWNVAGRLSRLDEQVDRVLAHDADVICLQEVIPNALARWTERLQAAGYAVAASAVAPDAPRVHRLGVLVASRHPILVRRAGRRGAVARAAAGRRRASRPAGRCRCGS